TSLAQPLIRLDWELSQKSSQRRYWLMGNVLGDFPSQSPEGAGGNFTTFYVASLDCAGSGLIDLIWNFRPRLYGRVRLRRTLTRPTDFDFVQSVLLRRPPDQRATVVVKEHRLS
ncbi:MAG TPA: hypothetical protein VMQ67_10355, partial [Candidatus Saccharimonadales bacterium]|nr:hypothetical protein [Candidatus Saccharimonadales bacterium]